MTTTPTTKHGRWLAGGAALTILLTGCGGGGNDATATGGGSAAEAGIGAEEFGLSLEELATRIEEVEASIGDCMTAAGFEYVPVDFATVKEAMDSDGSAPGVSDEDFLAQFGFGISTRNDDPVGDLGRGEQNVAIFNALSSSDQAAYSRALWGEHPLATFARAMEDEDLSQVEGCTRAAVEQFFSGEELSGAYINPGDVLIEQDARVIAAMEAWSTCMRDAGYDYGHPDEVPDDIREQLAAILGGADPATLTGASADALTELQGYERAVAAETTSCEEEHVDPVTSVVEDEVYGSAPS